MPQLNKINEVPESPKYVYPSYFNFQLRYFHNCGVKRSILDVLMYLLSATVDISTTVPQEIM